MPQLLCLFGQDRDQIGIGVTKRVDRDASAQIQVSAAVLGRKPGAFALDKGQGRAGVGRQNAGDHGGVLRKVAQALPKTRAKVNVYHGGRWQSRVATVVRPGVGGAAGAVWVTA